MDDLVVLWEKPMAKEKYMIAGWRQWADAGSISSGLPQYLVEQTEAKRIGKINPGEFYLFQIPGTHHLLRPEIKLEEGYRKELRTKKNQFFYSGDADKGLVIFIGDEPHMNEEQYAEAFFSAVQELGVRRVVALGGVYGEMPYDRDRQVSCVYSLREMKEELADYAVAFSNYEGGTTIGTYLVDKAEKKGIEFLVLYAFVPSYNFAQLSQVVQSMRVEHDFKAWHDLLKRLNYMFGLGLDLTDLELKSDELNRSVKEKIDELDQKLPELEVKAYIEKLTQDFTETSFMPLSDVWEQALGDIFDDKDRLSPQ